MVLMNKSMIIIICVTGVTAILVYCLYFYHISDFEIIMILMFVAMFLSVIYRVTIWTKKD